MNEPEKKGTITILVVDDEPDLCDLYAMRLEKAGFVVEQASGGDEAIAFIEAKCCHAIICDINMPGTNGFDVLNYVRRQTGKRLPFIFVTGYGEGCTEMVKAKEMGPDAIFSKPISTKTLIEKLHELCRNPKNSSL